MTRRRRPPPTQPVTMRRSSSGCPRSIGMSKMRDLGRSWAGPAVGAALSVMSRVAWYAAVLRVAMDSSNALLPDPRGYGRYARDLAAALRRREDLDLVELGGEAWRGPAVSWEQIGLPRALRRDAYDVVHTPHPFLSLRRPCAG